MQITPRSCAGLFVVLILTTSAHGQDGRGFTDWSKESGVAEIVQKHYQVEPKLWLAEEA